MTFDLPLLMSDTKLHGHPPPSPPLPTHHFPPRPPPPHPPKPPPLFHIRWLFVPRTRKHTQTQQQTILKKKKKKKKTRGGRSRTMSCRYDETPATTCRTPHNKHATTTTNSCATQRPAPASVMAPAQPDRHSWSLSVSSSPLALLFSQKS